MNNDTSKKGLYDRIDDTIMKGVNAGVRAWNWTTGRTKTDLARGLMYSSIFIPTSYGSSPNILAQIIAGAIILPLFHFTYGKEMKEMGEREEAELNKETQDFAVERYKKSCEFFGPTFFISSRVVRYALPSKTIEGDVINLARDTMFSGSFYVMRADYQTPRKDCVRRGLENLSKALEEISLPQPVPIPVSANYEGRVI